MYSRRSYDVDNSPADILRDPNDGERYETATAEFRMQGRTGRLDHLIGAYFSYELTKSRDSYQAGEDFESYLSLRAGNPAALPSVTGLPLGSIYPAGMGVSDLFRQRATDVALFTHDIYALTDDLSLVAGLRYGEDRKDLTARLATDNPGCSGAIAIFAANPSAIPSGVCIPNLDPRYDGVYATDRSEGDWAGTAGLTDRFADGLAGHVSYSRGYKAGGFQMDRSGMNPLAPALSQLEFGRETADSYEIGVQGTSADGTSHANATIFFTKFNDYQFSYFTGLNRQTKNVPELTTKGFEIETHYQLLDDLLLSVATTYQEVIFGDSGFPAGLTQIQGSTAPIAPRWIAVGTAAYQREIPDARLKAFAYFDIRWQSKSNVGGSASPSPSYMQNSYAIVGARLGLAPLDRRWRLDLWARNLFNQHAWSILNSTTLQNGSISGYVIDPRSWGLTASVTW
jgi:outer membrane receptor protein involved in Fe transport